MPIIQVNPERLSTPTGIKKIYFRAVVWLSWQSHNHFQYQRSAVGIQSSTKYYIKHWPIFKKNKNIFWYLHSQFFRSYRMPSRAQRCRSKADGIFKLPTCPRSSSHSGDLHEGGWIISGHRRSTVPHLSGQRRLQHGSRRLQLEFPGQGARRKSKLRL